MLLLAAALHARAQNTDLDRARAELQDAEIAYETSLMLYPPCGSPRDDFERAIRSQATELKVRDFTLTNLPESEAFPASPFRIERMQIRGRGEFGDLQWLLRRIASLGQIGVLDFEAIHLRADQGWTVTLDGTIAMGCHDRDAKAMEPAFPSRGTPAEMELALYRDRSQKLRGATTAAKQLEERMQPRRITDALLVLADVWGRTTVGVTEVRYTVPALTVQGVVLGASGKAAVESSLRQPRFELTRLDWSPTGDCHAFGAAARLTAATDDTGEALPMDMFIERDAKLCDATSAPPKSVTRRGSGPLTVHLRNVDVRIVFLALNNISPADGFILEPDVAGRVNVDFDNVTMDEALAALSAAGVAFATPGPIHRICKTACGEPTVKPQKPEGEPLALSITEASLIDILRAFEQLSGLEIHAPYTLKGDVSVFVTEAPWDAVFDGLVSAFHRTYTIDGTNLYIGDRAAALPLAEHFGGVSSSRTLVERDPKKIAAADFRLAGIAGANGTWNAYGRALGSPKLVFIADRDASLLDASVAAVAADRVTLRTTGGREVVVTLAGVNRQ